jgi:hypothetical protein
MSTRASKRGRNLPNFYVAQWGARRHFGIPVVMMRIVHQILAAQYGLSQTELHYTLHAPVSYDGSDFRDLDAAALEKFLVTSVLKPTQMRADGIFFGLSVDSEVEPHTVCFASFFRLPSAVSAVWAASGPQIGENLGQRYVEEFVTQATGGFTLWNQALHEELYGQP